MKIFKKIQQIEKLSPGLRSLYLHRVIRDVGLSLLGIFVPIFLYVLTQNLNFIFIYYGLMSLLYFLFLPLWAKLMQYVSLHWLMILGNLFLAVFLLFYYLLAKADAIVMWLIIVLLLVSAVFRLFYWVPYHVDFARFVDQHHRGRQLSFLGILISLIGIILPITAAFIITQFGYPILFVIVIVIILVSSIPLFFISPTREKFSFGFFESFKKLLSKKHIKSNLAFMADGWQMSVSYVVWSIFIFIILKGEYMEVGLISAGIILLGCILRYIVGEATDKYDKNKLMHRSSILYSLGWVIKAVVSSGWHIFFVGIYHNFTNIIFRTPLDVLTYEISADEGHYIDEFSVLKEMALHLGKVFMFVFALILIQFLPMVWIFVLTAVVSLVINLISKEEFYLARKH